jgi:hypothetical protein
MKQAFIILVLLGCFAVTFICISQDSQPRNVPHELETLKFIPVPQND